VRGSFKAHDILSIIVQLVSLGLPSYSRRPLLSGWRVASRNISRRCWVRKFQDPSKPLCRDVEHMAGVSTIQSHRVMNTVLLGINIHRLPNIVMFPSLPSMDGYICQHSINGSITPSEIMSKFIGKPVHLIYKGPTPRAAEPSHEFPNLKAFSNYQDLYPMMMLSEENLAAVEEQARPLVGTQGVSEKWREATLKVER
jgi:hypothetical protein